MSYHDMKIAMEKEREKEEKRARLGELVDKALADGFVLLPPESTTYVARDAKGVVEVFDNMPYWAAYSLHLDTGEVYHEAGTRRHLLTDPKKIKKILTARAKDLVDDPKATIWSLLELHAASKKSDDEKSAYLTIGSDAKLTKRLEERIVAIAKDPERAGRVTKLKHREALEALGLTAEEIRALR